MASTGASHGDFLLFSFLCLNISFSNNYCPYLWFCIYGPVGERSRGGGGREREREVFRCSISRRSQSPSSFLLLGPFLFSELFLEIL